MPELLVLRHAQAADAVAPDHERPLTPRGFSQATQAGRWLAERGLHPQRVLCSSAVRAQQTAERVLAQLTAEPAPLFLTEQRLYLAAVPDLLDVLAEQAGDAGCVLLVGHNPGLAELVEALSGHPISPEPGSGTLFPTATLARLQCAGGWHSLPAGCAPGPELVRHRGQIWDPDS